MKPFNNKAVFLDRDGVLNKDNPEYTYHIDNFRIIRGVPEALQNLKKAGFLLIVVTNQSGIDKKIYTQEEMERCHQYLQVNCAHCIDHFYFSPYHRSVTRSLLTKPDSLMFEKAIARFGINVMDSWMIGDRGRDIIPARALGIRTIQVGDEIEAPPERGDYKVDDLTEASRIILG